MTPLQTLLGFAAWTLLLVLAVFLYRGLRFLGGTPINHWPRGNKPADDAPWVLVARMGQSLAHLSGTGPVQVFVRATFWAAQLVLFVWMLAKLMA